MLLEIPHSDKTVVIYATYPTSSVCRYTRWWWWWCLKKQLILLVTTKHQSSNVVYIL